MITVKLYGLLRVESGIREKQLEADTVRVIETISAEVEKNSDGSYTLVWNEDLYNAVSGGLYYAEER